MALPDLPPNATDDSLLLSLPSVTLEAESEFGFGETAAAGEDEKEKSDESRWTTGATDAVGLEVGVSDVLLPSVAESEVAVQVPAFWICRLVKCRAMLVCRLTTEESH
jgi:hypothetical protein